MNPTNQTSEFLRSRLQPGLAAPLKFPAGPADLITMAAAITQICDPALYSLDESIKKARASAAATPAFELHLVKYLQTQCLSGRVALPVVFRGLEVLVELIKGGTGDESRLITLLRPFLRSSDPQIASKCVLVLGRQSRSMVWLRSVMNETDERMRANLIESLWKRTEPEVELVLKSALADSHPRVAANAVYGLYLLGSDLWPEALDGLVGNSRANFRRSGVWVVKATAPPNAPLKLQPLIHDSDPHVRRAAFDALKHLRDRTADRVMSSPR